MAAAVPVAVALLNELQTVRLCLLNVRRFIIKTKYFSLQQILQKFNCNCKQKPESALKPSTHWYTHSTHIHTHTHMLSAWNGEEWGLVSRRHLCMLVCFYFCLFFPLFFFGIFYASLALRWLSAALTGIQFPLSAPLPHCCECVGGAISLLNLSPDARELSSQLLSQKQVWKCTRKKNRVVTNKWD